MRRIEAINFIIREILLDKIRKEKFKNASFAKINLCEMLVFLPWQKFDFTKIKRLKESVGEAK